MAQLDKPVLPPLLYRYRALTDATIERELAMVREQLLWCSFYRDLNDPMEGFYDPTIRVRHHDAYARVAKGLLSQKQTIGICCLTDTPDNEIMWTHYAGHYTGICVSYRPQRLLKGLPENAHVLRLGYGASPPVVGLGDTGDLHAAALKILSHKKFTWSHEREWRVLAEHGLLRLSTPNCVRGVLLGSRIAPRHREFLHRELRDLPVRIEAMNISKYRHTWTLVQSLRAVVEAAE